MCLVTEELHRNDTSNSIMTLSSHFFKRMGSHRRLLLKQDTQPRSHLVVEVCIHEAYVLPPPPQIWHPPHPGAMPRSLQE